MAGEAQQEMHQVVTMTVYGYPVDLHFVKCTLDWTSDGDIIVNINCNIT